MSKERVLISSGSPREPILGYSRAVKVGAQVFVAGTTSGGVAPHDAPEQAREIFRRIEKALADAGATLNDVVRTRVYLTNFADFDAVGEVHGEIFGEIRPASAVLVVSALAAPELVVEVEADAVIA